MTQKQIIDAVKNCKTLNSAQKAELAEALTDESNLPSWLVTLLKVVAYAIGLVLAGYGTTAAAANVFINLL